MDERTETCTPNAKNRSNFGEVDVEPAPPHITPPSSPCQKRNVMFLSGKINYYRNFIESIYAFPHMMHENLGSKSTHSLYTFIKSEARK